MTRDLDEIYKSISYVRVNSHLVQIAKAKKVTELLSQQNFIRFLFAPIREETKLLFSMFAEARLNIPGGVDLTVLLLYGNNILIAYSAELGGKSLHSKPNSK